MKSRARGGASNMAGFKIVGGNAFYGVKVGRLITPLCSLRVTRVTRMHSTRKGSSFT